MESNDIFPNIRIFSVLYDAKIDAYNVSFELPKSDYIAVIQETKNNNEFQRKRIARKSSVQALMKDDLEHGCLLPALTLALPIEHGISDTDFEEGEFKKESKERLAELLRAYYKEIKILDGLQRTNAIDDVHQKLGGVDSPFYKTPLRFEMYLGINKIGILYRMLTLNTGQTPMTLRHQVEILYHDLYPENGETNEIKLIRQIDNQKPSYGRYGFQSMIDGFEAYLYGSPFPLDRFDIVEYVKGLYAVSSRKYGKDMFEGFIKLYHTLVTRLIKIFGDTTFDSRHIEDAYQDLFDKYQNNLSKKYKPFAHNIIEFLTKGQSISAFGAAINGQDFSQIQERFPDIVCSGDANEIFSLLIVRMAQLNQKGGNIGNTQREFLYLFFKKLFGTEIVSIEKALSEAFRNF